VTWVAGLNHGGHDASCALLRDGDLVVFVEQERLSRRKRALDEPPADALAFCLDFAGITLEDVDLVALGSNHDALARWLGLSGEARDEVLPFDQPDRLFPRRLFGAARRPPVTALPHHLSHAATAFWPSGFDDAAILVMDAMGEDTATLLAHGDRSGIRVLRSHPIEHSLGFYYEAACEYAGFDEWGAGKLMGLAAYGTPGLPARLGYGSSGPLWEGIPATRAIGRAMIDERRSALLERFRAECFPHEIGLRDEVMAYARFAASAQAALQGVVLALARELRDLTGSRNIVLSGGVALNCSVNGALARSGLFDGIFVQPASHDAGVGLGAALLACRDGRDGAGPPARWRHAYWGPAATDDEAERALRAAGLTAVRLPDERLCEEVAGVLAGGGVVAWHQGRAEVGPRALGARSLLGDPRSRRTLVRLNRIKGREMWRPLAPSVLAADFDRWFDGTPNPFMLVAAEALPEVRHRIPAVVHVDGSARPQAVDDAANPRYRRLIEAFRHRTGVPMVVNTSLNGAGQPIACSAADSIEFFQATDVDALAVESFLVKR
jgi:carbamoyltransferase